MPAPSWVPSQADNHLSRLPEVQGRRSTMPLPPFQCLANRKPVRVMSVRLIVFSEPGVEPGHLSRSPEANRRDRVVRLVWSGGTAAGGLNRRQRSRPQLLAVFLIYLNYSILLFLLCIPLVYAIGSPKHREADHHPDVPDCTHLCHSHKSCSVISCVLYLMSFFTGQIWRKCVWPFLHFCMSATRSYSCLVFVSVGCSVSTSLSTCCRGSAQLRDRMVPTGGM